jgi:hypothetical protein
MQAQIRLDEQDVTEALAEMGLSYEILSEAIMNGEMARDNCTANDAPGAPGYFAWNGTVRALREILLPRGWTRDDGGGYSRVVNAESTIAIAVVTGDEGTGRPDAIPSSKYAKGPATEAAVNVNQGLLFDAQITRGIRGLPSWITWMLIRRRTADGMVYAELSLPYSMDAGKVDSWQVRIILRNIETDPNLASDDVPDALIDVPVRRRP